MIRYEKLEKSAEHWRDRFAGAEPFPHLVIDELFDPAPLAEAARNFPRPSEMAEKPGRAGVLEMSDRSQVPPRLVEVSDELLSARFTSWLSVVSGLDRLTTDPAGNWGVLRQSGDGVEGKIHVAPERHPDKPWYRRLTLILHLTEGLSDANGGCFQLWDRDKAAVRTTIAPLFNRAVVFLNSPTAYHNASRTRLGPGQLRRIMQALYFTEQAPAGAVSRSAPGNGASSHRSPVGSWPTPGSVASRPGPGSDPSTGPPAAHGQPGRRGATSVRPSSP